MGRKVAMFLWPFFVVTFVSECVAMYMMLKHTGGKRLLSLVHSTIWDLIAVAVIPVPIQIMPSGFYYMAVGPPVKYFYIPLMVFYIGEISLALPTPC